MKFLSSLGQKISFGVYYRPPNTSVEYFQCLRGSLATIDDKFDKIFLAGDFNLPSFDWINQVPLSSEPLYLDAYELLNDSFLTQVNFHPTRNNSILDLVLTTVPDLYLIYIFFKILWTLIITVYLSRFILLLPLQGLCPKKSLITKRSTLKSSGKHSHLSLGMLPCWMIIWIIPFQTGEIYSGRR